MGFGSILSGIGSFVSEKFNEHSERTDYYYQRHSLLDTNGLRRLYERVGRSLMPEACAVRKILKERGEVDFLTEFHDREARKG